MDRDELIDSIITIIAMTVAVCLTLMIVDFVTEYSISETEKNDENVYSSECYCPYCGAKMKGE